MVKLPLFACKARDNWEVRFVTCPIARMPYTNNISIIPFLDLCVSFEAFRSTKSDITIKRLSISAIVIAILLFIGCERLSSGSILKE